MIKVVKHMGRLVPCINNPKILCVCQQHKLNCLEKTEKVIKDEKTSI